MEKKEKKKTTDFVSQKRLFLGIYSLFLGISLGGLLIWGLNLSIDFTGGTVWEISFTGEEKPSSEEIDSHLQEDENSFLSVSQEENYFILNFQALEQSEKDFLQTNLIEKFGEFTEKKYETVGPTMGKELLQKTIIGILLSTGLIVIYVAYRFKDIMYGACAVLAMFTDSFILLGIFSWLGKFYGVQIDTLFVTAVLTILSFSVHDTVVIFDRIRELLRIHPRKKYNQIVNLAMNETLIRSLNNSLTIIFMLLALLLLGGETIRWFTVALLIGTISGTYSSTFVASPLLTIWYNALYKSKK